MITELIKIALVLLELGVLIALLKWMERRFQPHPEVVRKLLHMILGLTVLSFPWVFEQTWPVVSLCVLAMAGLAVLRFGRGGWAWFSTVIGGVHRPSLGEFYYPLAVAVLWLLSGGDALLFSVPVLVLALADAVAALVGVRYGSVHYATLDGSKSVEGSCAFFIVTFMSVHVPVLLTGDTGRLESLLLALIVALLVMLIESVSWRGLDNLFVPLGTFAFLLMYGDADAASLAWKSVATIGFVAFMLVWRKRTSLDDAALLGGSLFGYAALMLGGWLWLYPPAAVFACHTLIWSRNEEGVHRIGTVISVTLVGFACLIGYARQDAMFWLWPYSTSFAVHLALIAASYSLWERSLWRWSSVSRFIGAVILGWGVVMPPLLLNKTLAIPDGSGGYELTGLIGLSIATVAVLTLLFVALMPGLYAEASPRWLPNFTGFFCGFLAATAVWARVITM